MQTSDLIEAIRSDIKQGLREEILAELQPEINSQLYANVFDFSEALRYLKVSDSTLRRMVKLNEVPFFRQRGNLYFRQIDLSRHISDLVKKEKTMCAAK